MFSARARGSLHVGIRKQEAFLGRNIFICSWHASYDLLRTPPSRRGRSHVEPTVCSEAIDFGRYITEGRSLLATSEAKIPWRDIDLSASQPVITYQSRRKVSTTGCGTPSHHSSDRAALLISFVFKVRRPSSCIITTPL